MKKGPVFWINHLELNSGGTYVDGVDVKDLLRRLEMVHTLLFILGLIVVLVTLGYLLIFE